MNASLARQMQVMDRCEFLCPAEDLSAVQDASIDVVTTRFMQTAGNPKIPTLEEATAQALTKDEAARFAAYMRPLVENRDGTYRSAAAYLAALEPTTGAIQF